MKKIFMIAAALCATILMAEPTMAAENVAKPSKKEIRTKVTESYESFMECVDAKTPVLLMVDVLEFYEWTESLDEKSQELVDKEIDKWKNKNDDRFSVYSEYMDVASDVLIFEEFEDNDPQIVAFVYLDTVAELLSYDEMDAAKEKFVDYIVYLYMVSKDDSDNSYASQWMEYNPEGADIFVEKNIEFNEYEYLKYIGDHFEEDYTTMSESEMIRSYISHLEGIADSYEGGAMMEVMRHYIVVTYLIENVENGELMELFSTEWEEKNPERAELVYEALDILME